MFNMVENKVIFNIMFNIVKNKLIVNIIINIVEIIRNMYGIYIMLMISQTTCLCNNFVRFDNCACLSY